MSERSSYEPGTPSWVDLACGDVDRAADFYQALLGWEVPPAQNPEQTGGYRQALLHGAPVAGIMPLMQEQQPVAWSTYVSVADADATASAVADAGGTVALPPMDVLDIGRMAVFGDPSGAHFGVWQPRAFTGAGVVNEAGAVCWNELDTRDPEGASSFYGAVFGWVPVEQQTQGGTYTSFELDGRPVAGMLDMRGRMPDEVPPHWEVYFAVPDADAAVSRASELGGGALFGPVEIEQGRIAVLADSQGASFAVIALNGRAG